MKVAFLEDVVFIKDGVSTAYIALDSNFMDLNLYIWRKAGNQMAKATCFGIPRTLHQFRQHSSRFPETS